MKFASKLFLAVLVLIALSACGEAERMFSSATGRPTEHCHDGVIYLQFQTGPTVKYHANANGQPIIAQCKAH